MPAEPRSLKELFLAALAVAPAERSAWLERECDGDVERRRQVELLLAAHDAPQSLLDRAPAGTVPPEAAAADTPEFTCECPGTMIGPYKLLEPIGQGGMGTVWMAEQTEPVKRLVAVKLIKAGMDSRHVLARFEAERQALALMDHPNIAQFIDAGVTGEESRAGVSPAPAASAAEGTADKANASAPSALGRRDARPTLGRPYFVMELVQGIPITRFCEAAKLSTRERLELVAQVCRAVQHAHQKGIIHRDLKPSNILVTEQDGRPVPKVIDFGVAKATGARLTDKTIFTGFAQLIGTPDYMSPEQAGLGSLDIDTRSDIYSLGVLLYELLTGHTPFDTKDLLKSGFEAVLRTIREVDPPKPSTRLTQELLRAQERKGEREKGRAADPVGDDMSVGGRAPKALHPPML
jgi:serine/threonine protein kinase